MEATGKLCKIFNITLGIMAYADDIVIACYSREDLQDITNQVADFCRSNEITINVSKTYTMIITKLNRADYEPIKINNREVE